MRTKKQLAAEARSFYAQQRHSEVVYIILNEAMGIAKVGFTINLKRRVTVLQVGSGAPLTVYCAIPASKRAREMEQSLLHALDEAGYLSYGEWFIWNEDSEQLVRRFLGITSRKLKVVA